MYSTCQHSEVCILKTHVNMLAYEVDLLLFNFLKEYFIYGGLIGGIFAVLDNK
jgi:hypothetical protein